MSVQSGQPSRKITVDLALLPVELQTQLTTNTHATVKVNKAHNMNDAVGGLKRWLPFDVTITPYMFRDLPAEQMRESGWASHETGAALGHRSHETSNAYGRNRQPGSRKNKPELHIKPSDVKTSRPVRTAEPFDPQRFAKAKTGSGKKLKP